MIVRIKLFAVAKQLAGADSVAVEMPALGTVGDLRAAAAVQYPALAAVLRRAFIAINAEYARDEMIVPAHAEIACIPPVSGG